VTTGASTVTTRRPLAAANWKMHLVRAEARALAAATAAAAPPEVEVLVFPSTPLLAEVASVLAGTAVGWGGQDLHPQDRGAFTGDTSGAQLADLGCRAVLCGHSERRRDHREDDETVAAKMIAAERHGLLPVVCIGETLEEREAGRTLAVLERQVRAVLARSPRELVLAYEPVWAIGTGRTATPAIAGEAHRYLRGLLAQFRGDEGAAATRILYGGSVTPENAAELLAAGDVDGFLVGGASLDAAKFSTIMRVCAARPV
jgi:triosephosphate isomerase